VLAGLIHPAQSNTTNDEWVTVSIIAEQGHVHFTVPSGIVSLINVDWETVKEKEIVYCHKYI
jgi:hypothetical protein